ncbi:hypothetical protein D3C85_1869870 [compost metagenome]
MIAQYPFARHLDAHGRNSGDRVGRNRFGFNDRVVEHLADLGANAVGARVLSLGR